MATPPSKFTLSPFCQAVSSTSATTKAAQDAAAKAAAQNKKLQKQLAEANARYKKLTAIKKANDITFSRYKEKEAMDKELVDADLAGAARSDEKEPTTNIPKPEDTGTKDPTDFQWNLPPHSWSLPLRPMELEGDGGLLGGKYRKTPESFHGYRRGRVWSWDSPEEVTKYNQEFGKDTKASSAVEKAGKADTNNSKILTPNYKYGFQFMWNPAEVTSTVSRNMDVTPSSADKLRVVSGVFPGQESVSFNVMLDRTNDFACARGLQRTGALAELAGLSGYYKSFYPTTNEKVTFEEKMDALLKYGTMADLEYLFKAINGSGLGDGEWASLLGKKTANLGYLQPTLMGVTLGPDRTTSLSYVGWITSITMSHSSFTEEMIPLRTTVSFTIECFAGSGIGAGA